MFHTAFNLLRRQKQLWSSTFQKAQNELQNIGSTLTEFKPKECLQVVFYTVFFNFLCRKMFSTDVRAHSRGSHFYSRSPKTSYNVENDEVQ